MSWPKFVSGKYDLKHLDSLDSGLKDIIFDYDPENFAMTNKHNNKDLKRAAAKRDAVARAGEFEYYDAQAGLVSAPGGNVIVHGLDQTGPYFFDWLATKTFTESLGEIRLMAGSMPVLPSLGRWTELQVVSLTDLEITRIVPGAFKGLDKLRFLSVTGNNIEDVPDGTLDGLIGLTIFKWYERSEGPLGLEHID